MDLEKKNFNPQDLWRCESLNYRRLLFKSRCGHFVKGRALRDAFAATWSENIPISFKKRLPESVWSTTREEIENTIP